MNLKYAFYKGYYKGFDPGHFEDIPRAKQLEKINKEHFEQKNRKLFDFKPTSEQLDALLPQVSQYGTHLRTFSMTTIYPGLFTGSGYTHETGTVGELKLGFFFDHTTGLPILPGHSVKGTLRSAFPRFDAPQTKEPMPIKKAKVGYILQHLGLIGQMDAEKELEWVKKLELQIFEGRNPTWDGKDGATRNLPMRQHDAFLDAGIKKAAPDGHILGLDAITPHGSEPTKNPIPLPFLKVLPGVEWQFSMMLRDTTIDEILVSADLKCKLFQLILLDLGIGAKTNVGYGQFKGDRIRRVDTKENPGEKPEDGAGSQTVPPDSPKKAENVQKELKKWKRGVPGIKGKVEKIEGSKVFFSSDNISDWTGLLVAENLRPNQLAVFKVGAKFPLELMSDKPNSNRLLLVQVTSFRPIE